MGFDLLLQAGKVLPGLNVDAECSGNYSTLDAIASTEGDPREGEQDTTEGPTEVVVRDDELGGVLDEDCTI